jgi:hypothetical protein
MTRSLALRGENDLKGRIRIKKNGVVLARSSGFPVVFFLSGFGFLLGETDCVCQASCELCVPRAS